MTKTKVTKKALASSLLALMLCVSMLLGTTYAWFTDSVVSGGNIIKSGTLDVEMWYADGTTDPGDATWNDASTGAIFNYDLWEPGYTEVRHIQIKNVGTLALKYKVQIVANGTVSNLADVIDVYYLDPAEQIANRDALAGKTPMGTLTDALAGMNSTASGVLVPVDKEGDGLKSSETITIALKMKESAGNEYQNKSIGTDFSIQLIATQWTYENDSFDDQYDADAVMPTVVGSFSSMKDLLSGITGTDPVAIQLSGNIAVPNDEEKSAINIPANANVTIDLNGHTISGSRTDTSPNYGLVNVGMNANLTIENGTVTYGDDGDSTYANYRDTITVQSGTLTVKNATISNTCPYGISSAIDVISGSADDAVLIIEDSTINSTRYGVRLFANSLTGAAKMEMTNTTVTATSAAIFLQQPSTNKKGLMEATITDSTIKGKYGVYLWDCYAAAGEGDNIKLTLNGTTTLTSTESFPERAEAVSNHTDGKYPRYDGGIIVDYSTASGDSNLKLTDNRN